MVTASASLVPAVRAQLHSLGLVERKLPITPRMRALLNGSHVVAEKLGHDWVGVEHFAIAMLVEGESIPARILKSLGVDAEQFMAALVEVAGGAQQ